VTLLASASVYVTSEDARSDVILAGATTLFGGFAVGLLARLPFYPRSGLLPVILGVVWVFVLTGLVPLLLARYRGDGIAAFGLDAPRSGWTVGVLLAVPVVVLGVLRQLVFADSVSAALLGRMGGASFSSPLLGDGGAALLGLGVVLQAALFVATTLGTLLLVCFLTARGRTAFRSPEVSTTELLRTFAMGATAVALVLGVLRSIGAAPLLPVLLHVAALAVLVLLADRQVQPRELAARSAVLTPVVFVVVSHVFAFGGLFRGDLLAGLYTGALGAATAAVVAVLLEGRRLAWAVVPLMVALHWWPSCLSPLALELGAAAC
jgi:hypothetical protein